MFIWYWAAAGLGITETCLSLDVMNGPIPWKTNKSKLTKRKISNKNMILPVKECDLIDNVPNNTQTQTNIRNETIH